MKGCSLSPGNSAGLPIPALLNPPHDPRDLRVNRPIIKRLNRVLLKQTQNLSMREEAAAREMQVLHPLGPALISKPPRRHAEEVSYFCNGVLELLRSPTRPKRSRHHRGIRNANTKKLLKITDS